MGLTTIWQRYFFKETLKFFLLFITGFYFIYVLIDFSTKSRGLADTRLYDIISYYAFDFFKMLDFLGPFALLIAVTKTLCMLNVHNEIVALLAGGISLKRLMQPFILLGLICVTLSYINLEYSYPLALKIVKGIRDPAFKDDIAPSSSGELQQVGIRDGTTLLYKGYDTINERFYDLFWIRSIDEIWRIKHLYPGKKQSIGHHVDQMGRNTDGQIALKTAYETYLFEELGIEEDFLDQTIESPERLSLSDLWQQLPSGLQVTSDRDSQILTNFYKKLAFPWLNLLVVIAPAPFCVRFKRNFQVFILFALGIFTFLSFTTLLNASAVLGENQVIPPLPSIFIPFLIFFLFFGWKYYKME